MTRPATPLAALVAAALALACGKKPADRGEAPAARFDALVPGDDCLFHAAAAAPVEGAWLVAGACALEEGGKDRLVAVRVGEQGGLSNLEDVQILEHGWATNVLVASLGTRGAVLAWTQAVDGRARAMIAPIDTQGRITGQALALGDGKALAIAGGEGVAAVAVIAEPEWVSDIDQGGAALSLYLVDGDADVIAAVPLSRDAAARRVHASVSPAGEGAGWVVSWVERGVVMAAAVRGNALGARAAAMPAPEKVGLPPGARFWTPAIVGLPGNRARVAVLVSGGAPVTSGDPPGNIWIGEGVVGEAGWTWKAAVTGRAARIGGLAAAGDGLAWAETTQDDELSKLVLWPGAGDPEVVVPQTAIFDGAVALAGRAGRTLVAAPVPPDGKSPGGLAILLRSR